jgi:hypothetical protein
LKKLSGKPQVLFGAGISFISRRSAFRRNFGRGAFRKAHFFRFNARRRGRLFFSEQRFCKFSPRLLFYYCSPF